METLVGMWVLFVLVSAVGGIIAAIQKAQNPEAWAAQQIAEQRVKAAQDARRANAAAFGLELFRRWNS